MGFSIFSAKKEELGDKAPIVPPDFNTSEMNFF